MKTVLTTWGCVGVGDVVCPAPGAEWEVTAIEASQIKTGLMMHVTLRRGVDEIAQFVPTDRPVYILDKVTAAAERDGEDPAEVAAGVLTSGGLAPSAVRPRCPGDPSHYADSHDPGGASFGVPLDHGKPEPETVTPPGQTGAAILATCEACGALTYPSQAQRHTDWHVTVAHLIADVHTEVFGS